MTYKQPDFQACVFNPLVPTAMLKTYPLLADALDAEWKADPEIDKILRFVILVYDSKSPVRQNERDSIRRKNVAYDLAGFTRDKLAEGRDEIINEKHEVLFRITVKYLAKFVKDKEYAALCAFEFKYYENILELMTPIKGETNAERLDAAKKKSVISDEIIKDIKIIDDLWLAFFGEKHLVEKVKAKKFIPEMM